MYMKKLLNYMDEYSKTQAEEREVWFQVKIPLSHNLTLGCDHHGDADGDPVVGSGPERDPHPAGHPCPPQIPFYYFPIDHQQPKRPCD
eukprot:superscaffoldBa00009427_g24089